MKRTSSSKTLDTSDDAPKLTPADFERARPRIAGRDVSRAEWQAVVRQRVGKLRISIMLDAPIVEHFKALAGERGYQTIINLNSSVSPLRQPELGEPGPCAAASWVWRR